MIHFDKVFHLITVIQVYCKEYINDVHFKNTFNLVEINFAYETLHSQTVKPFTLFNYDISYKIEMQGQIKPTKLPNVFEKQTK